MTTRVKTEVEPVPRQSATRPRPPSQAARITHHEQTWNRLDHDVLRQEMKTRNEIRIKHRLVFSPMQCRFVTPRVRATASFTISVPARLPHQTFRGLLDVHSRYGLLAGGAAVGDPFHRMLGSIVASTAAPIATGWKTTVAEWELHPLKINALARRTDFSHQSGTVTTSPPRRVASAVMMGPAEYERKCTEPSAKRKLAPPEWSDQK
jgi:hypothetical protein